VEDQRADGMIDEQGKPIHDLSKNINTIEHGTATNVGVIQVPRLHGMGGVYCENGDLSQK
jgi:hypothetical protein